MIHMVKCNYKFFESLKDGTKTFEVRKKDRLYKVGDYLAVNEFIPDGQIDIYSVLPDNFRQTNGGYYSGYCLFFRITYILDDPEFCKDGMVVLGLARCEI